MSLCEDQVQEVNSDHFILSSPKLQRYFWSKDISLGVVIGKVICSEFFSLPLLDNYILFSRNALTRSYGCTRHWLTELEVSTQPNLGQSNSLPWEPEIGYNKIPVLTQMAHFNSKDVK